MRAGCYGRNQRPRSQTRGHASHSTLGQPPRARCPCSGACAPWPCWTAPGARNSALGREEGKTTATAPTDSSQPPGAAQGAHTARTGVPAGRSAAHRAHDGCAACAAPRPRVTQAESAATVLALCPAGHGQRVRALPRACPLAHATGTHRLYCGSGAAPGRESRARCSGGGPDGADVR